jgi:hypothetical protein
MLQSELARRTKSHELAEKWIVTTFNPWVYSDSLSLQSGFFAELRAALPKERRWKDARRQVRKWGELITPLASLAGLWGVNGAALTDGLVTNFAGFSPTGTQLAAEKVLRAHKQPILMILDDLDRLTAEELMHVFKLVRLVGRLPYVYYLLGYDEHTLVDLIRTTDLVPAENSQRALDYLEKIVQVRLDLPALLSQQVSDDFYANVQELVQRHDSLVDESDLNRLRSAFDEVLAPHLRTPRSLSRFFGQVDAFLPVVAGDVDFIDFLLITWLRVTFPGIYALVQERKNEVLGEGRITLRHLQPETPAASKARWAELLTDAKVSTADADDVMCLLGQLFPAVRLIRESQKATGNFPRPMPLRIAHPDYFDRYFSFGVPLDDLPDSVVEDAIREIVNGDPGHAFERLQVAVEQIPRRVLTKVLNKVEAGEYPGRAIAVWLAGVYAAASEWEPTFQSVRMQISALVAVLYSSMSPGELATSVADISEDETGLALATEAVSFLRGKNFGGVDEIRRWNDLGNGTNAQFETLYAELFARYRTVQPQEVPNNVWYRIWDWQELNPVAVKEFVSAQIDEGRWDPLEVMARVLQVSISTTEDGVGTIMGFNLEDAERLVDLDLIRALLAGKIKDAEPFGPDWRHQEATKANRRQFVLSYLRGASEPHPGR